MSFLSPPERVPAKISEEKTAPPPNADALNSPPSPDAQGSPPTRHRTSSWARRLLVSRLERIERGQLTLRDGQHVAKYGGPAADEPAVTIEVRDPSFYRRVLCGGSLGLADSYVAGEWTTDDLVNVLRLGARNRQLVSALDNVLAELASRALRWWHWSRRNSVKGSRQNISAHYDLGNEFFALFLDPTMTYSCALFAGPDTTLEQAQLAKYERICQRLQLTPADHVVEIGGGWGGFAEFAAREFGCRVTTTTISQRQYDWAAERVRQAGLADRITVLQQDYRRLSGQFDKLVSIEMIEAVGHAYFATYFGQCARLLKPDGLMALQGITIPDQRYEQYLRSVDFIQKYIFPGGCLPSLGTISAALGRATDLRLVELKDFSLHYAETLRRWNRRFEARRGKIMRLIPSERFFRTWQFYFAYCEAGFREGMIGLAQMLLAKAGATYSCHDIAS